MTDTDEKRHVVTIDVNGTDLGTITFKDGKRVNGSFVIPEAVATQVPRASLLQGEDIRFRRGARGAFESRAQRRVRAISRCILPAPSLVWWPRGAL